MIDRDPVPVNKELLTGTVPVNKELLTGMVPVNNLFLYVYKILRKIHFFSGEHFLRGPVPSLDF